MKKMSREVLAQAALFDGWISLETNEWIWPDDCERDGETVYDIDLQGRSDLVRAPFINEIRLHAVYMMQLEFPQTLLNRYDIDISKYVNSEVFHKVEGNHVRLYSDDEDEFARRVNRMLENEELPDDNSYNKMYLEVLEQWAREQNIELFGDWNNAYLC